MPSKKPFQSELQSKTVIISETKEADSLLANLQKTSFRDAHPAKRLDWKTIAILILILVILAETLWLFIR